VIHNFSDKWGKPPQKLPIRIESLRRGECAGGEARKRGSDNDFFVAEEGAGVAQLVERLLPKQDAEGSSPFTRFLECSPPRLTCSSRHFDSNLTT
jgi:hypothetical protein